MPSSEMKMEIRMANRLCERQMKTFEHRNGHVPERNVDKIVEKMSEKSKKTY